MDNTAKLIYRIAKSYYEDGLTQHEIGRKFGLSRIKVSRLLKEAVKSGAVKIMIFEPKSAEIVKLEEEIEQKYSIDEVVIVESSDFSYENTLTNIGRAAANYLDRILRGDETIALAWGNTIHSLVEALPRKNFYNLKIVQLMGGLGASGHEAYGTNLIIRAAHELGGKEYILASPGGLPTKELRDVLLNDPQVSETLKMAMAADIAIVGLGSPKMTLPAISAGIISKNDLDSVIKNGAVGDVCLHFIDAEGEVVNSDLEDRIVAISLDSLKNIPKTIGLAGGVQKFEIVKAALTGNIVDVLITDSELGEKLVE